MRGAEGTLVKLHARRQIPWGVGEPVAFVASMAERSFGVQNADKLPSR